MAINYIDRNALIEHIRKDPLFDLVEQYGITGVIESFPAADVITRDEGIRLGAELAAMHGSDATSQDLEKAYWRGFEDAMQKRDVQPVKHGRWIVKDNLSYSCSVCRVPQWNISMFCPYCGAKMDGEV